MKLTKALRDAGIIEISPIRNTNGSYTCKVLVDMIDHENNGTNFRRFSQRHTDEFAGLNFLLVAAQNPILKFCEKLKGKPSLFTIDGRHTVVMWKGRKKKVITADVHFNMTDAKAGALFYELTQNSKRMAPWDAYAAAIQGGYTFALDIDAALNRFGFSCPNDDGYNSKTADFNGFTPLKDCHDLGVRFLHSFLTVLTVWKGKHRLQEDARKNVFQRGLIDFLVEATKQYSAKQLATMLSKRTASQISERAVELANCDRVERGHFKIAFYRVLEISDFQKAA